MQDALMIYTQHKGGLQDTFKIQEYTQSHSPYMILYRVIFTRMIHCNNNRIWRPHKDKEICTMNIGRTSLLRLPREQNGRPIGCNSLLMLTCISPPKHRLSHLWRLIYGLLLMEKLAEPFLNGRQNHRQGTKLESRKIANSPCSWQNFCK